MNEATKTIELVAEGKNKALVGLVPEGISPRLYINLARAIMGVGMNNTPRPDEDFLLFLYVCKRTGLDPLTKQIYPVYRWDSRQGKDAMVIQAGIDGIRLIAQRSGEYAGQDDAIFEPIDEATKTPRKASVTVYKIVKGVKVGFTGTARWSEYAQFKKDGSLMGMWGKMPYNQLAKCAESLALRKGFPNELSGIYSEEEMAQSTNILAGIPTPDKFIKPEEKIEVLHGASEDTQVSVAPIPSKPGEAPDFDEIRKQIKGHVIAAGDPGRPPVATT